MTEVRRWVEAVSAQVGRVILGKDRETRLILLALLAGRHVLIEDVPGVGKTTLVRALAAAIGASFQRIQFTPDLLPSDITGVEVYDPTTGRFSYRPGPLMAQIVLADEINRTSPKTQSALLEAMEEAQVTVDGQTHTLPQPFLVLATQNPLEYEGTFPLPESQLDRFALCVRLGYTGAATARAILHAHGGLTRRSGIEPGSTPEQVLAHAAEVRNVHVADAVADYIVAIARATRTHPAVYLGASPRATLHLYELSRAAAAAAGRTFVTPDDVKDLVEPVLAHRLVLRSEARWNEGDGRTVLREIVADVPVPGLDVKAGRRAP